jgi:hypothetical protein
MEWKKDKYIIPAMLFVIAVCFIAFFVILYFKLSHYGS